MFVHGLKRVGRPALLLPSAADLMNPPGKRIFKDLRAHAAFLNADAASPSPQAHV